MKSDYGSRTPEGMICPFPSAAAVRMLTAGAPRAGLPGYGR